MDELTKKVDKNRATIYRYESDAIEMPASMLQLMADTLNPSPDDGLEAHKKEYHRARKENGYNGSILSTTTTVQK